LLAQVLTAFGKNAGPDDLRGPGQRKHDALEAALRLALGASGIPGNSGMKIRAQAVMSLADLLAMDGVSAIQQAWLAARAGEPGWFCGAAARATACAAQVTPVVTGSPDWTVLSEMADVFLEAHGYQEDGGRENGTGRRSCGCTCGGCDCPPAGLRGPLSPAARLALERTLLALVAAKVRHAHGQTRSITPPRSVVRAPGLI
jgi:hypothetical protein